MNQKNVEYLDKQIFYSGFGDGHGEKLKEKIKEGKDEFALTHQQDFGKDSTVATLQFRKSKEADMYFLNSYSLMVKNAGDADPIKQTFYINNDMRKKDQQDITLKEGYNLLSGRAVNKNLVTKEGETYNAWLQLDFKTMDARGNYEVKKFNQNYGYDLEKTLGKHPIVELSDATQKERLMDSLKRGNRQAVTLQQHGEGQKVFIEAAPQFKSLNFYDSSMKRLQVQATQDIKAEGASEKRSQGKQESKTAQARQDAGSDEDGADGKSLRKSSRSKGQAIS